MNENIRKLGDIRISVSIENNDGVPYALQSTTFNIEDVGNEDIKTQFTAAASLCNDVVAAAMGSEPSDNLFLFVMALAKQGKLPPHLKKAFCRLFCPMDDITVLDLRGLFSSGLPPTETPSQPPAGNADEYVIPESFDEVLKKLFGDDYDA